MEWDVAGDSSSETTGVKVDRLDRGRVAIVLTHRNTGHYVGAQLERDEAREIGERLLAVADAIGVQQ
jgi:hypothetical protein